MTQNLHRKVKHHFKKKIFTFRIMMSYISNEVHFIYALKDIILHFLNLQMIFETSKKIYMCHRNYELKELRWHELCNTYIKTNFRCEKKYWDNFSIFLGKITNWWEHNFSKVINTSGIQLMVLYLIKIVSNHRWAKIKEKFNLFFFFWKKKLVKLIHTFAQLW